MFIKLTYYGKNRTTLVNPDNIQTVYQVYDRHQNRFSTKVCFTETSFINVEEDLSTIMELTWKMKNGSPQSFECDTPTIETRFEDDFYQSQPLLNRRKRIPYDNYNSNKSYNDNQY